MQLLQPQEVEVFYLLPAIRKALSHEMKAQGKSQKDIAELLGVTQAAVSQYLHDKRAQELPKEFAVAVKKAVGKISDTQSMIRETQVLLEMAKKTKLICKLHAQVAKVPHACEVCFE